MTAKITRAERDAQTALRHRLLRNGYTPLANVDKMCVLKNWPRLEVSHAMVDEWHRSLKWRAIGLRLDNHLVAIDVDIDDPDMRTAVDTAMCEACPELEHGLVRFGRGAKLAIFVRLHPDDEPFNRLASTSHVRPGHNPEMAGEQVDVHRVEIFANPNRQMGAFGVHSLNDDGTVKVAYEWETDDFGHERSPATVPLDYLPVVRREQLVEAVRQANSVLEAKGWPRVSRIRDGFCDSTVEYDLHDDMEFDCIDDVTRDLAEMKEWAATPGNRRCSYSFAEPGAVNRTRCLVTLDHEGNLSIFETASYVTHKLAGAKPEPTGDKMARLFEKLQERGISIPEEHPEAPDKFKEALVDLHENWAFCGSRQRQCLPVFGDEEGSMSVGNLRIQYATASYEKTGPRGGTKRISPVDVWLQSPERIDVVGYQFAPDRPRGVFGEAGERHINQYAPPPHDPEVRDPHAVKVFEDLIAHLVPNHEAREWLKDRIAHKVQNPVYPGVAVLHVSGDRVQGTGRGTLFDILHGVFGREASANPSAEKVFGDKSQSQYTDWQQGRVLATLEEVLSEGDASAPLYIRRKMYERLKEAMEPRPRRQLLIRKGLPNFEDLVCVSYFMATNYENALPIDPQDRRIVVIEGTNIPLKQTPLYARINRYRSASGPAVAGDTSFSKFFCASVYNWLMERDVSAFSPFDAPDWGGKAGMVDANRTELDELADEVLDNWPLDWAERSAFIDRFTHLAERRKLGANTNLRHRGAEMLKERWPIHGRQYFSKQLRREVYFRTAEEKARFEVMSFAGRSDGLTLQQQLDSRASPELLAKRLGIVALDGGKHDT